MAAAGNDGATAGGLASPAHDPYVLAVAGADVSDDGITVADWSSSGDGVRDPDIAAPGAHINSLRAPGSDVDRNHPEGFVDDETFRGSGTSEAAAVMAGVVALVRQAHPDWSPDQVKSAITATATPIEGASPQRVGSGFVDADAAAAVAAPVATQTFARAAADGHPGHDRRRNERERSHLGQHVVGEHQLGQHELGEHELGEHELGEHSG